MEGSIIPEDLIVNEILIRLHVKSLLRFRCVCKAWHSVISNRDLIESHRQHSQSRVHLLHGRFDIPHGSFSIHIERLNEEGKLQHYFRLPSPCDYGIINSSHDLIVLSNNYGYMLSNPAMRELAYLPRPPSRPVGVDLSVTGFGFVSSQGKYKVISIACGRDTQQTCEVFTVGVDNCWREGKSPPYHILSLVHAPYVDGKLHVMSLESKGSWYAKAILLFNLEKETWSVMELPSQSQTRRIHWELRLREIQGLLSLSCCFPENIIEIWMLRDYANKFWSKDFVIDVTMMGAITNLFVFPLEVMTDGRILLQMYIGDSHQWFYFDPRDGSCQLAGHKVFSTAIYAENLVPIMGF